MSGVVADLPETRYTRSADGTNLAYQVSGDGPLDLVFVHVGPPIDLLSEDPGFIRVRRRLGTFSRTVWFDHRGMGSSEGDYRDSTAGDIFDADLIAVLDAVGFQNPAFVVEGSSGPRAIHFTTTHPERVSALVLLDSFASYRKENDYPWGLSAEALDQRVAAAINERWSSDAQLELLAPSRVADQHFRSWFARASRLRGGPDQIGNLNRATFAQDVRTLLPSISAPTLVLHREANRWIEVGAGRYLAEHIPTAKFVLLPGADHMFFVGDTDALVDETEEFLTGVRSGAEGEVILAAVLFTDIVASTQHQAQVGPREWSRLADLHNAMVRAALAHNRGHEVNTTGDGFLVTFEATGRALRCAAEVVAGAKDIGLDLRVGVHTGEVEVRGGDLGGLAVIIAKRVCDLAERGQVLVTETVRGHMVGADIEFDDQGEYELKGVPGTWRLYALTG
jgi:class 3 adenylate cyclase/pimeloyl-ACP methyl ester carboxylesterase